MPLYGADVASLRTLAGDFERIADRLDANRMAVGSAIQIKAWFGPAAVSFRLRWDSEYSVAVASAVRLLRENSRRARANADDQERASAASGGALTALTTPSTQSHNPGPRKARDFVRALAGMDGVDGVRIEKILCEDGAYRYVVYINGTSAASDGDLSVVNNLVVVTGTDSDTLAHIKRRMAEEIDDPSAEVALVGFSQGGMLAQQIADDQDFNVKSVLTFGSPEIPHYNNMGGADLIRLRHYGDPVLAVAEAGGGVAQLVTSADRGLDALADLISGKATPPVGERAVFSAGTPFTGSVSSWGAHNLDDYEWVAEQFDNDTGASAKDGQASLGRFTGEVVRDVL